MSHQKDPRLFAVEVFVVLSHLVLALVAAFLYEALAKVKLPGYILFAVICVWVILAAALYKWLVKKSKTAISEEISSWRRYQQLERDVLAIVAEFLKDRYRTNHELATKITACVNEVQVSGKRVIDLLEEADKERREHVRSALEKLSVAFTEDLYLKPDRADRAVQDRFKVSFYAVETQNERQLLLPKWRHYPNEGSPRTPHFQKGEGASGLAWKNKRIVVCENGGEDPLFKDMWDGGGQKQLYASMVCMPAIEDIPSEKLSEVYGILTIDTPTRKGYFLKDLEQYWADLLQPICNMLVYCKESERRKEAFRALIETVDLLPKPTTNPNVAPVVHSTASGKP